MSRYIDADTIEPLLKEERDFHKKMYDNMQQPCEHDDKQIAGAYYTAYSKSYHAVKDAPTVDAVPVVHGEWTIDGMNEYELSYGCIGYEPRYRCSRCGITTESYLRTEKPIMPEDADFPNYCPNCGAKMRTVTDCHTLEEGER